MVHVQKSTKRDTYVFRKWYSWYVNFSTMVYSWFKIPEYFCYIIVQNFNIFHKNDHKLFHFLDTVTLYEHNILDMYHGMNFSIRIFIVLSSDTITVQH